MIYLDNAATTKINEMALKDLIEKSKFCFGNPSTSYSIGVQAKKIINEARNKISSLLHCDSKDLFFTSGGTEANNIIIQSFLRNAKSKSHIICSSIEHESILNVVKNVKNNNVKVTFVNPDKNGIILPESIEKYIDETNTLVCVQLINNEVGSLQPIKEIAKIVHKHNAHIHVDAVQAIGHIAVDIKELDVDSLSASAHKLAGPKGVGFLYTKQHDVGLCFGGGQEKNVKSGTENVPSISAMSIALEQSLVEINKKQDNIMTLMSYLKNELLKENEISLNVDNKSYSAILSFRIKNISNEALVNFLDMNNICVSTGSACSGNTFERSHVLKAIGLTDKEIDSTLRVSLSCENTIDECKAFITTLKKGISLLKAR